MKSTNQKTTRIFIEHFLFIIQSISFIYIKKYIYNHKTKIETESTQRQMLLKCCRRVALTHVYVPRGCRYLNLSGGRVALLYYTVPVHSTKFYDYSFTVQAVRLWNALPLSVRQAQSHVSFKS